jgi:hypothetical protein
MIGRGRRVRRGWRLAGIVAVAAAIAALGPATPGSPAGVTTHAWMALDAIAMVEDPQLEALLDEQRDFVRAGAHFPDSGYVLTNQYGEEAHWQRFHDAYLLQVLDRNDCGPLTAPDGPCAPSIAFWLGMTAHGMGDQVWDWLYEPNSPDLDEYYAPEAFGSFGGVGGQELTMDLVAVAVHSRNLEPLAEIPDRAAILGAFEAVGFTAVDDDALNLGWAGMRVAQLAETAWATEHIHDLREAMPWMSNNLVDGPGGVRFAAQGIAGHYDAMWDRLLTGETTTSIAVTYPAPGERRIPAEGWERSFLPGSSPGRGGARNRIAAVMTQARPYVPTEVPEGVRDELPEGAMVLTERDTATPVAAQAGYPKTVPYGSASGAHTIAFQPAADLAPCTWYRAQTTEALVDALGNPSAPYQWDFRTGLDAEGRRCPDDPLTPDERYTAKVIGDVLDRDASDEDLFDAVYDYDRGTSRRAFVLTTLASEELRQKLVRDAFTAYLGREPDPAGAAYWTDRLTSLTLPEFHARLLGSPEVFRKGGGTNAGYVSALYPLVHGRSVDPGGLAYWTARLDRGLDRGSLARQLLTSRESARRTVRAAYADLLDRAPDPGGLAHWTGVVQRGADPRQLWDALAASAEYDRKAQLA